MRQRGSRGHLPEFGLAAAKGIGRVDELIEMAKEDAALPAAAQAAVKIFAEQLKALDASIDALGREIARLHAQNPMSKLLAGVPGAGKIIASAIVVSVPGPSVFKSGRDFAAWLGLTPRQNSSGGKEKFGAITKQGNQYIRRLLVAGAASLLSALAKRKGALRDWIAALLARKPARLVTVAIANKLARIVFAMMTAGEGFRAQTFERA